MKTIRLASALLFAFCLHSFADWTPPDVTGPLFIYRLGKYTGSPEYRIPMTRFDGHRPVKLVRGGKYKTAFEKFGNRILVSCVFEFGDESISFIASNPVNLKSGFSVVKTDTSIEVRHGNTVCCQIIYAPNGVTLVGSFKVTPADGSAAYFCGFTNRHIVDSTTPIAEDQLGIVSIK